MACDVIPTRDVLSGQLLDEASEDMERLLREALHGTSVMLLYVSFLPSYLQCQLPIRTDGWKDDSKNSITGVNVATSQKVRFM